MADADSYPIRWVERFMRADAEQPVSAARMVLSTLRANQWVLFERRKLKEGSTFYPFKKNEVLPRLENAKPETAVAEALRLREGSSSQVLQNRVGELSTGIVADPEEPWVPRKILVNREGRPVAIGVPVVPRQHIFRQDSFFLEDSALDRPAGGTARRAGAASPALLEPTEVSQDYSVVRIFYGTDRSSVRNGYSNQREITDSLHFGTCDVTIPRDHRLASLESPKWWRFEFRWNPKRHIVLQNITELPQPDFFAKLRSHVLATPNRDALVFIHGFDVSFEDAARRTAQLSYDLGFKGTPILYSWPSAGSLTSYLVDEATIDWTKPHLAGFLADVAAKGGVDTLHIIAHSMGNRALVRILDGLSLPGPPPYFNQVVLAAPDIDTGEFLHLAASIQRTASRLTLYASSNDKAIEASKKMHEYPRAGESGPEIVVVPGLDTIDASNVDTSLVGHSYFAEKRTVISDLFYLIGDGKAPDERHSLEPKVCSRGKYWAFRA